MGKKEPLVSVVIPAYNVGGYIKECVESVKAQTYKNLEIILVDDGSTDGTGAYCDEAAATDARVTVIHQKNGGVVSARDAGVQIAHGEYLSFVDGDDFVEPDMVGELVGRIGSADMVSVGVCQEQAPGRVIERTDCFASGLYEGRQAMASVYGKMIYDQGTGRLQPMTPWIYNKLYLTRRAKRIHHEVGRDITFAEDSVFLYRYMLKCESIVICYKCLYHYRYREDSAIHKINTHMLADINRAYLALVDVFRRHWMGQELLFQLQRWVVVRACIAMNEMMGFDGRIHIPEFVADTEGLAGRKLVLYGAGRVGQDTWRQLHGFGYEVSLWVDKGYRHYQERGMDVRPPEEALRQDWDLIVIAIEDERTAAEIREWLVEGGIPDGKILWKEPLKLY